MCAEITETAIFLSGDKGPVHTKWGKGKNKKQKNLAEVTKIRIKIFQIFLVRIETKNIPVAHALPFFQRFSESCLEANRA